MTRVFFSKAKFTTKRNNGMLTLSQDAFVGTKRGGCSSAIGIFLRKDNLVLLNTEQYKLSLYIPIITDGTVSETDVRNKYFFVPEIEKLLEPCPGGGVALWPSRSPPEHKLPGSNSRQGVRF
jgi:hypothetical protein